VGQGPILLTWCVRQRGLLDLLVRGFASPIVTLVDVHHGFIGIFRRQTPRHDLCGFERLLPGRPCGSHQRIVLDAERIALRTLGSDTALLAGCPVLIRSPPSGVLRRACATGLHFVEAVPQFDCYTAGRGGVGGVGQDGRGWARMGEDGRGWARRRR